MRSETSCRWCHELRISKLASWLCRRQIKRKDRVQHRRVIPRDQGKGQGSRQLLRLYLGEERLDTGQLYVGRLQPG